MAIKSPNRYQRTYLPEAIEDYVANDDPVRAYDAMIDAIGHEALGIPKYWEKRGNSPYDPMSMVKLLVFAYSYGWKSSRKIERALYHNMAFIWLVGGLKPDHKTIAEFRRKHKKCLKRAFKQTVRICIDLKLISGNVLFLDGSKIRGNASINQTKRVEYLEEKIKKIDTTINQLLDDVDSIDHKEAESESFVKMNKELQNKSVLEEKIQTAIIKSKKENLGKVNLTDNDAVTFKGRQGCHSGFNAQIVSDEKNGLLAHVDVINKNNDLNQFSSQITQANKNLDKDCDTAAADAGYFAVEDLKKISDEKIDVIVPSPSQISEKVDTPFSKSKFRYDTETNEYICPAGKVLYYSYFSKQKNQFKYRMKREADCLECCHYGVCTKAKRGRSISRLKNEEEKLNLELRYASETGQKIYKRRKECVELPFGHIKRNLGCSAFLVRGLKAVNAEFSIYASCFNIARMLTLLGGTTNMIKALTSIK